MEIGIDLFPCSNLISGDKDMLKDEVLTLCRCKEESITHWEENCWYSYQLPRWSKGVVRHDHLRCDFPAWARLLVEARGRVEDPAIAMDKLLMEFETHGL